MEVVEKRTRFRWVVMAMIFIVYMIAGADRANIGVVIPFIKEDFKLSNTDIGAMASLFYIGYALIQIPVGFCYSKFGIRKIFTVSMVVTSLATFFIGVTSTSLQLKVARVFLGIAEGPLNIGIVSIINRWFPPHEKGTATGIFLSSIKFAPAVVPPICAYVIYTIGWREVFYICAIPGLIISAFWYWLVKDNPEDSPYCSPAEVNYIKATHLPNDVTTKSKTPTQKKYMQWVDKLIRTRKTVLLDTTRKIVFSWDIWGCALGYFFLVGITYAIMTWVPTYLITVKKYSVLKMGFVAAAPWVGAVVGNIVGGWLSDKVFDRRRKPLMLVTSASTVFMMYALLYAPNDTTLLASLLFMTGVFLNLGFSTFLVYPMGIASKEKCPFAASIVNTGGSLGGAFAPFIVGMILDSYNWDIVFAFLAVSSLLTFLILFTMIEPIEDYEEVKS